jgi:5-formyltetrahydrofolate cyclo-ligase
VKKAALRTLMIEQRKLLAAEEVNRRSRLICERFFAEFSLTRVKHLHVFLSIEEKAEVHTWPIIRKIWNQHPDIKIVVPVTPPQSELLAHHLLTSDTELRVTKWGIPEPVNSPQINPEQLDLVLVPLLCFDLNGDRVGYGKGFYDRFLTSCHSSIPFIGLSLFGPVELIENTNSGDIRLSHCLTPDATYQFE